MVSTCEPLTPLIQFMKFAQCAPLNALVSYDWSDSPLPGIDLVVATKREDL
jgi:hypothetical protein